MGNIELGMVHASIRQGNLQKQLIEAIYLTNLELLRKALGSD